MIQELEMLALLIAAVLWLPVAEGRRVVIFSDSEAAKLSAGVSLSHGRKTMQAANCSGKSSLWKKGHVAKFG